MMFIEAGGKRRKVEAVRGRRSGNTSSALLVCTVQLYLVWGWHTAALTHRPPPSTRTHARTQQTRCGGRDELDEFGADHDQSTRGIDEQVDGDGASAPEPPSSL